MQKLKFTYSGDDNQRVDKFLSENTEYSREFIKKLATNGNVKVKGQSVKPGYKLEHGDMIGLIIPDLKEVEIEPVKMDLDILFEDDDILVINKPAGLVVHPGVNGKYANDSLVNAVMFHSGKSLSGIGGEKRPGIVHRLDKDTSGVLVIAKNDNAHNNLMEQFRSRKINKVYLALVMGRMKHKKGRIESPIGRDQRDRKKMSITIDNKGKMAKSAYHVIDEIDGYSLLKVTIETGRTHQIRVHMASIGHPVCGDTTYGDARMNKRLKRECGLNTQFLHAAELTFLHPVTGKSMHFKTELPDDLKEALNCVFGRGINL